MRYKGFLLISRTINDTVAFSVGYAIYAYLFALMSEIRFMEIALEEAVRAAERGEVPVGAVLVDHEGSILAQNGNRSIEYHDPAGHAEMIVLREAGQRLANYRLSGTSLYVTLESCIMCVGAMVHARIRRLVFGATDPKTGGVVSLYQIGQDRRLNHQLEVEGGLMADECGMLLQDFFRSRRNGRKRTEG